MAYLLCSASIFVSITLCRKCIKNKSDEYVRRLSIWISFFLIFLLSAFRGPEVGVDTQNYMKKFVLIQKHSVWDILTSLYCERVEFGYALINKLVGFFTQKPYVIVVVNSAIVCVGMAYYTIHYTDSDFVAIILFACGGLLLQSFNITRQIIACIFLLNSWGALTQGKKITSVLLFCVAFGFHWVSILFLVVWFFYAFRKNRVVTGVTLVVSVIVLANYQPVIDVLRQFITIFKDYSGENTQASANGIWTIWSVELIISIYFLLCYFAKRKSMLGLCVPKEIQDESHLLCEPLCVIYYIILTFIGTRFNYFHRFGVFFLPFTIPLYLNFGKVVKHKSGLLYKLYTIAMVLCYAIYFWLCSRFGQYQYSLL